MKTDSLRPSGWYLILWSLVLIPAILEARVSILPAHIPLQIVDDRLKVNGEFLVQVKVNDNWQDVTSLPATKIYREKEVDLSAYGSREEVLRVRLLPKGGGVAHLDSVLLGGRPPVEVRGVSDPLALKKITHKDFDVLDVYGKEVEITFPPNGQDRVLEILGRIEATEISQEPLKFPLANLHKRIDDQARFFSYRLGAKIGETTAGDIAEGLSRLEPLFQEYSETGSGHPAGVTYGWVGDDREHLYVRVDFTPDNTRDGEADYCQVYIKGPSGIKAFKVTENQNRWGRALFTYTDKVAYEHKVYEFKIPFRELGSVKNQEGQELLLAFDGYGTAAASGEQEPAVAYDSVHHRYLVVYAKYSVGPPDNFDIYGKIYRSDGTVYKDEFLITPSPNYYQQYPAAAFDSVNQRFLVVWADGRGGAVTGWDIYGQWINAEGTIDGSNFPICTAGNTQTKPAVAFDDQNQRFLIVWQDGRIFFNNDIFGRILKTDGSSLTADFQIGGSLLNQSSPAVAFDRTNQRYLIVWDEGPLMGTTDIYGRLVEADGNTPNPAFGIATDPTKREETPDVAYDPIAHRFLVAYNNNLAIWGALLNANGVPAVANFSIGNHTNDPPRVAYDYRNQKYLAVWSTVMIYSNGIIGQRVTPSGTLDGSDFIIVNDASHSLFNPALAFNSWCSNFLVVYEESSGSIVHLGLDTVGIPACSSLYLPLLLRENFFIN
jgi:hypothetical protein